MIPVNTPLFDGNEKAYLLECIDSGWISSEGPFVNRFEEAFAEAVGRRHGISVSNGSAALDVAVAALRIGPGDEVILPTFTIISPAASVVRAGATPILVDCDPVTWNMDVNQIEAKISSRTKAIIVVHIYGHPVDLDPVLAVAEKHGLAVIEDAAEMHGQTYRGRACGSFGDISTFSFYANKHITTGEGGMVVVNDDQLADRCRSLRNLCFQPARRFVHEELGWNFRMTNLQAAVGLAQLEKLAEHVALKRRIGGVYQSVLSQTRGLQLPIQRTEYSENVYWVFGIVVADGAHVTSKQLISRLSANQVGTRPFFWPIHEQPVFKDMGLFSKEKYPNSEFLARNGFYLPSGLGLSLEEAERVGKMVIDLVNESNSDRAT